MISPGFTTGEILDCKMYPLTEVMEDANPEYLAYLSRKTGFMLQRDNTRAPMVSIHWFWYHLVKNIENNKNILNDFHEELEILFDSFGYIPASRMDERMKEMEKKLMWVFRYPPGGVFLPLEIFKVFMREKFYSDSGYFFSLLYQMSFHELREYASFLGNTLEGQHLISFENNTDDMALVLYIWYANRHVNKSVQYDIFSPEKGKILSSRHFLSEDSRQPLDESMEKNKESLPYRKEPLWNFLLERYPMYQKEIDQLKTMIFQGRKGFYRALSLIASEENLMINAFRDGILMPVWKKTGKKLDPDDWAVQTPREIRHCIRQAGISRKARV